MDIREPRYKVGDKVYCKQYKSSAIITGVSDYSFNTDKYLWRAGKKNSELEDLKKARWYIDKIINYLEN